MKKMDYEEFIKRTAEIFKANKIFGNLTNDNLSASFTIYQELLAEEKREVFMSTKTGGNGVPTIMDEFRRPTCPDCNIDMRLKGGATDMQGKFWNTAWVCEKCLTEYYSEKTVNDWMGELERNVQE
jgi:hypothetical protein